MTKKQKAEIVWCVAYGAAFAANMERLHALLPSNVEGNDKRKRIDLHLWAKEIADAARDSLEEKK